MKFWRPTKSAYKQYQFLRLFPHRMTRKGPEVPGIYHWLWWMWMWEDKKEKGIEMNENLRAANPFRADNTEGYSPTQLAELNRRFQLEAEALFGAEADAISFAMWEFENGDEYKAVADRVENVWASEL